MAHKDAKYEINQGRDTRQDKTRNTETIQWHDKEDHHCQWQSQQRPTQRAYINNGNTIKRCGGTNIDRVEVEDKTRDYPIQGWYFLTREQTLQGELNKEYLKSLRGREKVQHYAFPFFVPLWSLFIWLLFIFVLCLFVSVSHCFLPL